MRKLLKHGAIVSMMTSLSRIAGLVRDVLFATQFGAGVVTDAFLVAFKIPNFFRRLTAEGTFNQVFVPVLARIRVGGDQAHTRHFIASSYGVFGVINLLLALAIGLAAPLVIAVFAPGMLDNPDQYRLTIDLLRCTAPFLFFISVASMLGALLNFHQKFTLPAAMPIILNLCLITAIVYGAQWHSSHITTVAIAVSVAGGLQCLWLIPSIVKLGYGLKPLLFKVHQGVRDCLKLMVPVIFGTAIVQLSLVLDTLVASLLISGSITWLYYSDRLIELPLGVFAVALATVITPALSRLTAGRRSSDYHSVAAAAGGTHVSDKDRSPVDDRPSTETAEAFADADRQYRSTLRWALKLCLMLGLPSALGLMLVAPLIVNTLFEHGQFTAFDSQMTCLSVYAYACGLPGFMLIKPLVASFYAHEDTRTPLTIAALAICFTLTGHLVVLALHLLTDLPALHVGLALSTSLGGWINAGLLLRANRRRRWLSDDDPSVVKARAPSLTTSDQSFDSVDGQKIYNPSKLPEWHEGQDHRNQPAAASEADVVWADWMRVALALVVMGLLLFQLTPSLDHWQTLSVMTKLTTLTGIIGLAVVSYFASLWLSGARWRRPSATDAF